MADKNAALEILKSNMLSQIKELCDHAAALDKLAKVMSNVTDSENIIMFSGMAVAFRTSANQLQQHLDLIRYWNGETGGM